jgi:hypothetical protein
MRRILRGIGRGRTASRATISRLVVEADHVD